MSNEELNLLIKNNKSECSCDRCVSMCKTTPCIPTPSDVAMLIKKGYKRYLTPAVLGAPEVIKITGRPISIIMPRFNKNTGCVFLENNRCVLHNLGLKPSEGKIAHHNGTDSECFKLIIMSWIQ